MNTSLSTTPSRNINEFKFLEARPGITMILLPDAPFYTIVAVSNDFVITSGRQREEVIGKSHFSIFPENPADPSSSGVHTLQDSFNFILQNKSSHSLPLVRYDIPDGAGSFLVKYWKSTNAPVIGDGGEVEYIIHTSEDVTAQVTAAQREDALKGVEKVFDLFMHAPFVVGLVRGENHILELANEAAFKLWGKDTEIIGKPLLEGIPETKAQGIVELIEQVKRTGEPCLRKAMPVVSFASGREETHYFDLIYQPYYEDGSDTPSGVFTISHDVTELVMARKLMEESEKRIIDILESTTDAFYAVDANFNFTYVNKRAAQLWGRDRDALLGKHYWTEFPNAVGSESYHKHYEALREARPIHFEVISPLLAVWIEATIYPSSDGGLSVFFRDITERKQAEENLEKMVTERTVALEKANKELKRSNLNLEEFAYAASHDMKEPIRKIRFFADRLKDRLVDKLDEEDRRYFERLEAGTKRMNTLIDDLLLYSHVNRGLSTIETVGLNQVLSFVLDDLELHLEQKNATVDVGPLPTLRGRTRQLQQLFENLIGNALKYSKEGVVPVISLTSRLAKGSETGAPAAAVNADRMYHLIEVKDNGIGFEQADAERIFNVFTRLHGNTEYKGTGVGLSIAQRVVQNHGGYIWAEGVPGEGATFFILLPVE